MGIIISELKRYIEFNGRTSRKAFWLLFLFINILYYLLSALLSALRLNLDTSSLIISVFILIFFLPMLTATVRRLQDGGNSGWWALFPLVNLLLCIQASTAEDNKYGPALSKKEPITKTSAPTTNSETVAKITTRSQRILISFLIIGLILIAAPVLKMLANFDKVNYFFAFLILAVCLFVVAIIGVIITKITQHKIGFAPSLRYRSMIKFFLILIGLSVLSGLLLIFLWLSLLFGGVTGLATIITVLNICCIALSISTICSCLAIIKQH